MQPLCLWFTGLSGAGKTTLSTQLHQRLQQLGYRTALIDGDDLRQGLCSDLGFSAEDRRENIRRAGEVAGLMLDAGLIVLVGLISPFRADRDKLRQRFAPGQFIEVFVDTPLSECERRDVKGLYARARKGELKQFTGISSPYEPPLAADVHIRTLEGDIETHLQTLLAVVQHHSAQPQTVEAPRKNTVTA